MTDTWRDRLASGRVLLLDGGTGSELRRRGYALDPLAWSAPAALTDFELLRSIQSDYIAAGADVISTNTFAATRFVLEAAGLGERTVEVVERAVAAAREARAASGRDVAIAGSMSCLPPRGDPRAYPDARSESAAYRELAERLAGEGVDLIALEMLEDTEHAARACEAARDTGLPVWLGVSCRLSDDGALVAFDFPETPFARVLDALLPFAPDAVNVMHSPPGAVAPSLRAIRARSAAWSALIPSSRTASRASRARARRCRATARRATGARRCRRRSSRRLRATGSAPVRASSAAAAALRRTTSALCELRSTLDRAVRKVRNRQLCRRDALAHAWYRFRTRQRLASNEWSGDYWYERGGERIVPCRQCPKLDARRERCKVPFGSPLRKCVTAATEAHLRAMRGLFALEIGSYKRSFAKHVVEQAGGSWTGIEPQSGSNRSEDWWRRRTVTRATFRFRPTPSTSHSRTNLRALGRAAAFHRAIAVLSRMSRRDLARAEARWLALPRRADSSAWPRDVRRRRHSADSRAIRRHALEGRRRRALAVRPRTAAALSGAGGSTRRRALTLSRPTPPTRFETCSATRRCGC